MAICSSSLTLCAKVRLDSALCRRVKLRCIVKHCAKSVFHNFIPWSEAVVFCSSPSLRVDYFQSGPSRRSVLGVVLSLNEFDFDAIPFRKTLLLLSSFLSGSLFVFLINVIIPAVGMAVIVINLVIVVGMDVYIFIFISVVVTVSVVCISIFVPVCMVYALVLGVVVVVVDVVFVAVGSVVWWALGSSSLTLLSCLRVSVLNGFHFFFAYVFWQFLDVLRSWHVV